MCDSGDSHKEKIMVLLQKLVDNGDVKQDSMESFYAMINQDGTNDKEKKMTKNEQNNGDTVQKHHERKEDNEKSSDKEVKLILDTPEIITNAIKSMEETHDNMMLPNFNVNEYIPNPVQVEPSVNFIEQFDSSKKKSKNNSLVYGLIVLMTLLLGFLGILYFCKRVPKQVSR